MDQLIGGLCLLSGGLIIGLGVAMAKRRVRLAHRAIAKHDSLLATMPEGWHTWFFQGFSDIAISAGWVEAVLGTLFWTALGIWLMVLGVQLFV